MTDSLNDRPEEIPNSGKRGNEFAIEQVLYTADRDGFDDKPVSIDLTEMIAEIDIFEDLEKPYLTSQIVFMDDMGVISEAKIKGTEHIKIKIGPGKAESAEEELYFVLDFRLVSLLKQESLGDRTELYVINCISAHAYKDAAVKVSKSYAGKLENISKQILNNAFGDSVELKFHERYISEEGSAQSPIKVILPYISPLESIVWLMERATDQWGTPFFIWTTIWDQNASDGKIQIRLGNFLTMLREGLKRIDEAEGEAPQFIYSQAFSNKSSTGTTKEQQQIIKSVKFANIENTLEMMREGAVGSTISSLDTYTSQLQSKTFKAKNLINTITGDAGKLLTTVFDLEDKMEINGETKDASDWSSRQRNLLTSYGTYHTSNSYHDAFEDSLLLNKVRPDALLSMLRRNMIDITVSGVSLMKDKLSVGDVIELVFKNSDTENYEAAENNLERSGYYLIHCCRHIFKGPDHSSILTLSKVRDTNLVSVKSPWEGDSFLIGGEDEADEGYIDF